MQAHDLPGYIAFIQAAEGLKDTLRSGHTSTGRRESTAEHSWRLALFAAVLQDELGDMDLTKVLMLCLIHDLGEALGGDVPAPQCLDPAAKSERERADLATLLSPLPDAVGDRMMAVWEEYELGATPEAKFVKGLDKLETIIQHNQGKNGADFDYEFNLGYGARHAAHHPLLAALRTLVDASTRERARLSRPSPPARFDSATPLSLPAPHRQFLATSLPILQRDPRIVRICAGGSYLTDQMDEYSDLDLLVVVADAEFESGRADRHRLAANLGDLLSAFSGDHVGQPDLLICLYDKPLLHVDLKFVPEDSDQAGYAVLWARDASVDSLPTPPGPSLSVDLDWIEARFWTWVHYGAGKIGRGELMEALDFLSFLRMTVLGPLALELNGAPPFGVRRVETTLLPELMDVLASTVARYDAHDCARALKQCVALYRRLRAERAGASFGNAAAEHAAVAYLADTVARLGKQANA